MQSRTRGANPRRRSGGVEIPGGARRGWKARGSCRGLVVIGGPHCEHCRERVDSDPDPDMRANWRGGLAFGWLDNQSGGGNSRMTIQCTYGSLAPVFCGRSEPAVLPSDVTLL